MEKEREDCDEDLPRIKELRFVVVGESTMRVLKRILKSILKRIISIIRGNRKIKELLKRITIKYPNVTRKLLQLYRRNIPEVKLTEDVSRITEEEMFYLSNEAKEIYIKNKKR